MFRARRRNAEPAAVATSQELLRAAMQRSARRNARVASLRVGWRWLLWGLGRLARLTGIAALVAAPIAGGWYLWSGGIGGETAELATAPGGDRPMPPRGALATEPVPVPAADTTAAATQPAGPVASAAGVRLRLDESFTPIGAAPAAQSDTKINPNRPTTP